MTATGWLVLGGIALIFAWAIAVLLFEVAAKWALGRQAERTAAATFERDYIAENADCAPGDAEVDALIALAQIEDEIAMALAPLREPKP